MECRQRRGERPAPSPWGLQHGREWPLRSNGGDEDDSGGARDGSSGPGDLRESRGRGAVRAETGLHGCRVGSQGSEEAQTMGEG